MGEIWQTLQWIDDERNRKWHGAREVYLNRPFVTGYFPPAKKDLAGENKTTVLQAEPRTEKKSGSSKPNQGSEKELEKKLAQLEADFLDDSPEAETRRQKMREDWTARLEARKKKLEAALAILPKKAL